jgi:hypothetical protein
MKQCTIWCVLSLVMASSSHAHAGPGTLILSITDPHLATASSNRFGERVATLGSQAIIAAPFDTADGNGAGLVRVFNALTGSANFTLHNPAPTGLITGFGLSLTTLNGDFVVGAPEAGSSIQNTDGFGAAYRFSGTTGSLAKTYAGPSQLPPDGNMYGTSLAPNGSNLLVSEPGYDPPLSLNNPNYGAVHVQNGSTGAIISTIIRSTPTSNEVIGSAIATLNSNVLIAGAPNNSAFAANAGAAYTFDISSGAQLRAFSSGDPRASEHFGAAVAAIGNDVLIGAPNVGSSGPDHSGAVYLFDASTGSLIHTFRNPTTGQSDWFGDSLAVVGNQILIGSPAANSAFLYDGSSFQLLHTFVNPGPSSSLFFGASVAGFSNGNYLIGAAGSGSNNEVGAAYVFTAVPEPSTIALAMSAVLTGCLCAIRKSRSPAVAESSRQLAAPAVETAGHRWRDVVR